MASVFYFSFFSLTSSVNSQTKTSKMRDDKLGGGDHFSAAEKYKGRTIIDIIGLEKHENIVPLLESVKR
jgi:hypothetical protein